MIENRIRIPYVSDNQNNEKFTTNTNSYKHMQACLTITDIKNHKGHSTSLCSEWVNTLTIEYQHICIAINRYMRRRQISKKCIFVVDFISLSYARSVGQALCLACKAFFCYFSYTYIETHSIVFFYQIIYTYCVWHTKIKWNKKNSVEHNSVHWLKWNELCIVCLQ